MPLLCIILFSHHHCPQLFLSSKFHSNHKCLLYATHFTMPATHDIMMIRVVFNAKLMNDWNVQTLPRSTSFVAMTMIRQFSCQTIRQKSTIVCGRQPWVAIYAFWGDVDRPWSICNVNQWNANQGNVKKQVPYHVLHNGYESSVTVYLISYFPYWHFMKDGTQTVV